jgi:hypothetical protein
MPERAADIAQALINHLQVMPKPDSPELTAQLEALTLERMLSNIFVFRVLDFADQMACIKLLPAFVAEHPNV